jgi:hypothetical protein
MMASSAANQSQVAFERERDEWRRLIGQALLGFGDIEFVTINAWLTSHPTEFPKHCRVFHSLKE